MLAHPPLVNPPARQGWRLRQPKREPPAEDVTGQARPALPAQRTVSHDPGIREGADGGGNILAASLAAHREITHSSFRSVEHAIQYKRT